MTVQNTYSSSPFITYDGIDENGIRAEVRVVKGFGEIDKIEESSNHKAANIIFKVSNTKWKSSGWVPVNSDVYNKVLEAQNKNVPIEFRIETRRKEKLDRSTPISVLAPERDMEAARENVYKSLAAVKFEDEDDWTISKFAVTRIDEDPNTPSGIHSAYDNTPEELGKTKKSAPTYEKDNTGNSIESTAWFTHNRDGSVNPGSTAVSVPLNMYFFVSEWNRDHNLELSESAKVTVTKALLSIANKLQVAIYDGKLENPDLSLGSHIRARALVFEVIRNFYPLENTTVQNASNLTSWENDIYKKALSMWKWSITEIEKIS